jgi:hypothetical protein
MITCLAHKNVMLNFERNLQPKLVFANRLLNTIIKGNFFLKVSDHLILVNFGRKILNNNYVCIVQCIWTVPR